MKANLVDYINPTISEDTKLGFVADGGVGIDTSKPDLGWVVTSPHPFLTVFVREGDPATVSDDVVITVGHTEGGNGTRVVGTLYMEGLPEPINYVERKSEGRLFSDIVQAIVKTLLTREGNVADALVEAKAEAAKA